MKKNGVTIGGILIALGLIGRTGLPGGASAQAPVTPPLEGPVLDESRQGSPAPPQDPLQQMLCDYFHPTVRTSESKVWECVPPTAEIHNLIVTVPDPESTHLALYTDRFIESVMWAATDSDFILYEYRFPWKAKPEKEMARFADRELQKTDAEQKRKRPGLMLFHDKIGDTQRVLVVYLVPEEPTAGVNLTVLDSVLAYLNSKTNPDSALSIVGPTFSGSIDPLGQYLVGRTWQTAELISGSATDTRSFQSFSGNKVLQMRQIHLQSTIEGDERAFKLAGKTIAPILRPP